MIHLLFPIPLSFAFICRHFFIFLSHFFFSHFPSLSLFLYHLLMESYPKANEDSHFPVSRADTLLDDSNKTALTEVFLDQYTEVDVSSESEWLSNFVEECLSSAGNCLPPNPINNKAPISSKTLISQNPKKAPISSFPAKPRSQRGRKPSSSKTEKKFPLFKWPDDQSFQSCFSDPPLLEQSYWLADSELLFMPKKQEEEKEEKMEKENIEEEEEDEEMKQEENEKARRCSHCQTQKTPQWRAGPMGPKTLCNACGMRYFKSGRLLPEYRPAKSPTFVSYKHSNSHKKVLQMRMALLSSSTPVQQ